MMMIISPFGELGLWVPSCDARDVFTQQYGREWIGNHFSSVINPNHSWSSKHADTSIILFYLFYFIFHTTI
jgi:hypothetical protein